MIKPQADRRTDRVTPFFALGNNDPSRFPEVELHLGWPSRGISVSPNFRHATIATNCDFTSWQLKVFSQHFHTSTWPFLARLRFMWHLSGSIWSWFGRRPEGPRAWRYRVWKHQNRCPNCTVCEDNFWILWERLWKETWSTGSEGVYISLYTVMEINGTKRTTME